MSRKLVKTTFRTPSGRQLPQTSVSWSSTPGSSSKRLPQELFLSEPRKRHKIADPRTFSDNVSGARSSEQPLANQDGIQAVESDVWGETLDHVIMAVDMRENRKIGCACYIAREERLLCLEDVDDSGLDIIEKLKVDMQPTIVLQSPRLETSSRGSLGSGRMERPNSLVDNDDENNVLPYSVELRPSPEFAYEGALTKLINLQSSRPDFRSMRFLVPGDMLTHDETAPLDDYGHSDHQGKLLSLSAWLDLENRASIGCVGAIISHLQRKRNSEYLQNDPDAASAYKIRHIGMFTLRHTMFVNADTLISLQIIQPESHPSVFNQGSGTSGSKESLSLYGLFHHFAKSPQGRTRLRQLFLRPSLDINEINSRLDFVSVFTRSDNQIACQRMTKSFCKIRNMRGIMTLLHKGIESKNSKQGGFKSGVWAAILEFCYHGIDIVDALQEVFGAEQLPLCVKLSATLDKFQLQRIGKMVHDVVDLEISVEQHRTVVKRGVDEGLDQHKDDYDGIQHVLSRTAADIAGAIPQDLKSRLNVIYYPQLGFLITMPLQAGTVDAVYCGQTLGWRQIFTSENLAYFKDNQMHRMDQEFGDLWANICDIEIELAYDLAQKILEDENFLILASDLCGEFESLLALASGASQYNMNRPRIVNSNVICIRGGRHLLQEMTVPSYVPNDTNLTGGCGIEETATEELSSTASNKGEVSSSMILLTGPNYSGKSVYQKQVALIVYMAQIGSYVPAESAIIGITDKILTRITTRETVSKMQSSFMIDLQQVAISLNSCTRRSLVLIDEFGKGTETCDGAGLAAGVFNYLLSLGNESPKVIAATHLHEIFESGLFDNCKQLSLAHMEVRIDKTANCNSEIPSTEVTYLYNLREGRSSLSYGIQCAAMNGIPDPAIQRASELARLSIKGEDLVAVCSALSPEETEDLEDAEIVAREFVKEDMEKLSPDNVRVFLDEMLATS